VLFIFKHSNTSTLLPRQKIVAFEAHTSNIQIFLYTCIYIKLVKLAIQIEKILSKCYVYWYAPILKALLL